VLIRIVEAADCGISIHSSDLVADPIEKRLAHIGLQCAFVAMLERIDVLQRLCERLLHQIFGIAHVARPSGQATARPAPQWRMVTLEELVEGILVAGTGTPEQVQG